jgi:hypothetical protein
MNADAHMLIAVEKSDLYRVGVWKIDADAIGEARMRNRDKLNILARCKEMDIWESPYAKLITMGNVIDRVSIFDHS